MIQHAIWLFFGTYDHCPGSRVSRALLGVSAIFAPYNWTKRLREMRLQQIEERANYELQGQ